MKPHYRLIVDSPVHTAWLHIKGPRYRNMTAFGYGQKGLMAGSWHAVRTFTTRDVMDIRKDAMDAALYQP